MPQVTFVIPTYNRAQVLANCLRALDRQRGCGIEFETVVVDDGSTDNTVEMAKALQGKLGFRLRLIEQECNRGPAVARNRGVAQADTDLVIFIGDDIIVEP